MGDFSFYSPFSSCVGDVMNPCGRGWTCEHTTYVGDTRNKTNYIRTSYRPFFDWNKEKNICNLLVLMGVMNVCALMAEAQGFRWIRGDRTSETRMNAASISVDHQSMNLANSFPSKTILSIVVIRM